MKNTLQDLNNYLFEQLERINEDELTPEQLETQIQKAESICKIADRIIQNNELTFKVMQHMDEYGISYKTPSLLPGDK